MLLKKGWEYIRWFKIFRHEGIKVLWRLQFMEYLRNLHLKFQKARTKTEVFLSLPSWLSQFSWDSQQSRPRKTPNLVRAFWNFKRKVLKYPRNCRPHATLIPNLVKPLITILSKLSYVYSAQFVCPSPKVWDIIEKRLHRASVVCEFIYFIK